MFEQTKLLHLKETCFMLRLSDNFFLGHPMLPNSFDNIMIDLETYGRRPHGLIVSIGAVRFSTRPGDYEAGCIFSANPNHRFHALLNFDEAEKESRFAKDPDTLIWWREQNAQAYAKLTGQMRQSTLTMEQLIATFLEWLKPHCDQGCNVIGNSPSFDLVLLEYACQVLGMQFPVPHRAETDYRSITDLVFGADKPRPGPEGAHDALFDAQFQAQTYARAIDYVRSWRAAAQALA
jgi:DNA polymerase III epsilon subunit-like protein